MTRRTPLLVLGAALLLALAGFAFFRYFEWDEREIDLPPRGEARYNPLYALGKALTAAGHEVVSRPTLDLDAMALAPGDVLVLGTDIHTVGDDDAAALLDWVDSGGHLLFALPGAASEREPPLAEQLGLTLEAGERCVRWQAESAKSPSVLCGQMRIADDDEDAWHWAWSDGDGGYVAVRAAWGDGSWLALPQLRFLGRRELRDPNHAALTWALLQPVLGDGRVHLVYGVDLPPAYVLLVRWGWPVWIPALLALLAWLWRRSQRLGPILPLPAPDRRALLEHIRAAGEFAFRNKRGIALHAALKRRFDARLAREYPALAALEGEEQVRAIAAAWQLDPGWVRSALLPSDLLHPERFLSAIRTLYQLQALP